MLRRKAGILIFLFSLSFMVLIHTVVSAAEVIKIGGSGIALGSMKMLGEAFEKSNPGIEVIVLPSMGSRGAIKAVSKKAIDIGISARPLNNDETGLGILAVQYAKTPFIVIANQDVKNKNISTREIIRIFRGEMLEWPDGGRIRMTIRPALDVSSLILREMSSEINDAVEMARTGDWTIRADTDQQNADIIEITSGAVGFSALSLVIAEKRNLKILRLNGRSPSLGNLGNGSYSHFFLLYTLTNREISVGTRKFLDFMHSPAGKKILNKSGNLVVKK
jgi:phosphate transport system substrate-binding protein